MVEEPISLSSAFRPWFNIGTDKSEHSQAQPYGTFYDYYLLFTLLKLIYMCSIMHREAVSLNYLVWLSLGWIKILDLANSMWTLYHYTIEFITMYTYLWVYTQVYYYVYLSLSSMIDWGQIICSFTITKQFHNLMLLWILTRKIDR